MLKRIIVRLVYGLMFALPLMALTFAFAQASSDQQASEPQGPLSCPACHESFQVAWEAGAHGNSTTDPDFVNAWKEKGEPAQCLTCHVTGYNPDNGSWLHDGITCAACHDVNAANHPAEPMAAERAAKLCGDCHNETYFEWQSSTHREAGLDCVGCHDPHNTSLKAADASGQCASCHRSRASNYAHSAHSEQGLDCASCHLTELPDPAIEGHARLDHSFQVSLSTCNECHAYQMHDPAEVHPDTMASSAPVDAMAAVESLPVTAEPVPVSPIGFATLAGLFGLAVGVIVAPFLARKQK